MNSTRTSLDATALSASQFVINSVLDDNHWRFFGFSQRPERGLFFRAFVSAQQLAREDTLKKELPCFAFSEVAAWTIAAPPFSHRDVFLSRVLEISLDGFGTPVWQAYGFASRADALRYFSQALLQYRVGDLEEHGGVFVSRTIPSIAEDAQPDWLIGCARLVADQQSMFPYIREALTRTTSRAAYGNDIALADPKLLSFIHSIYDAL